MNNKILTFIWLASIGLLFSACAKGPSPEQVRFQAEADAKRLAEYKAKRLETEKMQKEILDQNYRLSLTDSQIDKCTKIAEAIDALLKRNLSGASFSFSKLSGLVKFIKGNDSWITPVTNIAFIYAYGSSTVSSYSSSSNKSESYEIRGSCELIAISKDHQPTIYEIKNGKSNWEDRVSVHGLSHEDCKNVYGLYSKITTIITTGPVSDGLTLDTLMKLDVKQTLGW